MLLCCVSAGAVRLGGVWLCVVCCIVVGGFFCCGLWFVSIVGLVCSLWVDLVSELLALDRASLRRSVERQNIIRLFLSALYAIRLTEYF